MSSTLEKLEQRIKELMSRCDRVREENESFRRAAAGRDDKVSSEQALEQIEFLKRENSKLRQKLTNVDKRLETLLEQIAGQEGSKRI